MYPSSIPTAPEKYYDLHVVLSGSKVSISVELNVGGRAARFTSSVLVWISQIFYTLIQPSFVCFLSILKP